jgi:hypothetical protein
MRFKVPQNVQREDQILWFLTLRQVIILILGFGLSYTLFNGLSKQYDLNQLEIILCWVPAGISAAISFLKIHGISLFKFVLLQLEQLLFRQPRRRWVKHAGEPFVSLTTPFTMRMEKKEKPMQTRSEEVSSEKIHSIAHVLDSDGVPESQSIQ